MFLYFACLLLFCSPRHQTLASEDCVGRQEFEAVLDVVGELQKEVDQLRQTASRQGDIIDTLTTHNEGPIAFTAGIAPNVLTHVDKNDIIRFETVITDFGGGYNNQTGIFVVPTTGLYMFACSLLDDSVSTNGNIMTHADIVQNTRVLGRVFAVAEPGGHRDQGANTVFTHATAGDQVFIRLIDGVNIGVGGSLYSTFSGYLMMEM
ncbi:complement C1q-like protein 4 isoform X2 [Mya arenaria]|uniref:complement C1q-like protein 4 isoform X2 n=1 Tax=Mya arenaria TaxID=6604 RepID=UPI0022E93150|nr:complement C1q-like protein 4 isoform X2 [Mya arenaria]